MNETFERINKSNRNSSHNNRLHRSKKRCNRNKSLYVDNNNEGQQNIGYRAISYRY